MSSKRDCRWQPVRVRPPTTALSTASIRSWERRASELSGKEQEVKKKKKKSTRTLHSGYSDELRSNLHLHLSSLCNYRPVSSYLLQLQVIDCKYTVYWGLYCILFFVFFNNTPKISPSFPSSSCFPFIAAVRCDPFDLRVTAEMVLCRFRRTVSTDFMSI